MANTTLSIPSQTPICNPKNGIVNQEWRLWFNKLYQRAGGSDAPSNGDISQQIEINKQDFIYLTERVNNAETDINNAETDINNLQLEVAQNTFWINHLDNRVTTAENDINNLELNVANNTKAITKNSNNITKNSNDINSLKTNTVQTIANLGTGTGVFKDKTSNTANFKTLKAGTNITLDNITNVNEIVINSTGGGGGTSTGFGDLVINVDTVGPSPVGSFTIKGGEFWTTSRLIMPGNASTVADYTSTSKYSYLEANTNYYVYFDFYSKTFGIEKAPTSFSLNVNAKLLWVIKTNATKISSAIDYRGMNYFIKPKTLLMCTNWYSGARTYSFNMLQYYYLNQVPTSAEINGVSGKYPRYMMWMTSLLCLTADKGYNPGEEADYTTGDGTIWGKPLKVNNNGNFDVYQGAQCKIWQASTNTWVDPTASCWAMVAKVSLEYH